MPNRKELEQRAGKKLLWAEIKVTKIIMVFFFFVVFLGVLAFLAVNRDNFSYVMSIVSLSCTLGGLTFATGSFYKDKLEDSSKLSRASAEFILAGFLIFSTFLLHTLPLPFGLCVANMGLGCVPIIIILLFELFGVVMGPLFLAAGFYRLVSVMEKVYEQTRPEKRTFLSHREIKKMATKITKKI